METIMNNIYSFPRNDNNEYMLSNIMITDDDIKYLLNCETLTEKKVLFYACHIDIYEIKNKELLNFVKYYTIRGCEIFTNKAFKISKEVESLIQSENVIYNSDFLEIYLERHKNSLKNLKSDYLEKINFKNINLSKVDLTFNYDFFQIIKKKKLEEVILPPVNFKEFNILDVEFLDCKFSEGTIFSYNFFQNIKNKKMIGCSLPPMDFNNINIKDVTLMFIKFSNNTIFPKDPNFFKNFNMLYACSLPSYDYKEYTLDDVNMNYCLFKENSLLPITHHLSNENINNTYPKSFVKLLHIVPIKNLNYDDVILRYGKHLTEQQKVLIYFKLKK